MKLVDEDTNAFNRIMDAFGTAEENGSGKGCPPASRTGSHPLCHGSALQNHAPLLRMHVRCQSHGGNR